MEEVHRKPRQDQTEEAEEGALVRQAGKQKKKKKKKVSAKDWHCLKKAFYGWGELFNLINIVYGEDHVLIGPTTYIFPVEGFDEPVEIDVEADSEEEEDPAGHEQPNSLWQIANQ